MITVDKPARFTEALSFYYDTDWLTWTPEVFQATIRDKFNHPDDPLKMEKAEALRDMLRSDAVLHNPLHFENLAHAVSETHFTHNVWEPAGPDEIAYLLYVIGQVIGWEKHAEISPEVRSYIAACLVDAGIGLAAIELGFGIAASEHRSICPLTMEDRMKSLAAWQELMKDAPSGYEEILKKAKKIIGSDDLPADASGTLIQLAAVAAHMDKKGISLGELTRIYAA